MRDSFIKIKQGEELKNYLSRLMVLQSELTSGDYCFIDRKVTLVMLMGLPKSYKSVILNLEQGEDNFTTKN